MEPSAVPATAQSGQLPGGPDTLLRRIFTGSGMVSVLAVLLALIIGGLLIASTDKQVATTATYFFARPTDFLSAVWTAATRSYIALFQGSVFNPRGNSVAAQFAPFMETLTIATPLITAGLGVALAFRAGLFNIGAQGQIIVAGILAAWVGFALNLPLGLHLLLVLVAGIIGGALWGGLVGVLKARTGAHEVILTIMFNYIALYFLRYLLNTPAFQRPGESNPISPILDPTAVYPQIFGSQYRLHLGFILAIGATVLVWWLLNRSTVGFEFRAVGANPKAAQTAGINVSRSTILVMASPADWPECPVWPRWPAPRRSSRTASQPPTALTPSPLRCWDVRRRGARSPPACCSAPSAPEPSRCRSRPAPPSTSSWWSSPSSSSSSPRRHWSVPCSA
jgi:simple sugar transport system permease protein